MTRYLLVQLADIGDLILTTPALSALREAQPQAHLTLLTTRHSASVIPAGLVDEIVTLDRQQLNHTSAFLSPANLRRLWALRAGGGFDALVFFHHFTLKLGTPKFALIAALTGARRVIGLDNGNGWFLTERVTDSGFGERHQAQYWLDLVARLGADAAVRPAQVAVENTALIPTDAPHPRIVIHPGSGGYSLARRWEAQHFASVADHLRDQFHAQIVLVGAANDGGAEVKAAMQHEPLDLTGKTSLPQLAGVIAACDLYIGADSGVMHLAAAVGIPLVAIFGPSNPEAWGPWTPATPSRIVRSGSECSPCSYVGHSIGQRDGCAARTCMRLVTPQRVIAAAQQLLEGGGTADAGRTSLSARHILWRRLRLLGLPVDGITYAQWLEQIQRWIEAADGRARHVCTINPEFIMIARQDAIFHVILERADLCVPDGVGLLWAARQHRMPLPERVTGSDGVPIIAERAAQRSWRLYLLGAAPGVAEKTAAILCKRYPGLQIAGVYSGSPAPEEEDAIIERVNASRADILFVAYGAPEQDKWIARNLPRLRVTMAMGVGGSFDFIARIVPRAPLWMRRLGVEWLFRLLRQPWRLRRMLRLPLFVLAVLRERS